MKLAATVDYPVIAVGDLHGQSAWLAALVGRLRELPEWPGARLVFLGDFPDRGPGVRDAVDAVLELLRAKPGSTAVAGNHDMALTRAAGLDGSPPSPYWRQRYRDAYDHQPTFEAYLGRPPRAATAAEFALDLDALRDAMPESHRSLFAALPWGVAATGHLFLHCGLTRDSDLSAEAQWACVTRKLWSRDSAGLKPGTRADRWFQPEYPAWVGADRNAATDPLPFPGRVQVTGHLYTREPVADAVKIRIDTTGGSKPPLTACLLRSATAEPQFIRGEGDFEPLSGGGAGDAP